MYRWIPLLLLAAACSTKTEAGTDEADTDTDADSDADSDSDTDTDVAEMTPGSPSFVATFTSGGWEAEDGQWSPGSTSSLSGVQGSGDVEVIVELDGNLREGNRLDAGRALWVDTIHDGYNFYYQGTASDGVIFRVTGRDAEGDYLWGELEGSITLAEQSSGETVVLEALVLESWPRFGS